MPHDDTKNLFKGVFILTIAAAITKILSAVYRIPFQNIVGDVGFYVYQQIYPIYGVAISLVTYGFPVVISKFVAESDTANGQANADSLMKRTFLFLSFLGIFLFLLVFLGAPLLAKMMGDMELIPLIKTISLSFLLIPFISVIRGYFQGKGNMLPTAVSQVVEQSVRVASILLLTFFLVKRGSSPYIAGEGALIGSIAGGVISLIVLIIYWIKYAPRNPLTVEKSQGKFKGKSFLLQGIAICISGMLLVLFQLVDSLNLFALLTKSGVSIDDAKRLKGVYDRGQPLLQLGTIAATSLALTLVPIITSAYKEGRHSELKEKIIIALKICMIVGLGSTIGLINIIEPTNMMLFTNTEGSLVLAVFSISILFSSVILTVAGILQGLGRIYTPAIYMLGGVVLKFYFNQWFIPKLGTLGASLSTVLSLGIISIFFIIKLNRLGLGKLPLAFFGKVLISILIMTVMIQLWMGVWQDIVALHRSSSVFYSLSGVAVGGLAYMVSIFRLKLFDLHELTFIPLGKKLQNLLRVK